MSMTYGRTYRSRFFHIMRVDGAAVSDSGGDYDLGDQVHHAKQHCPPCPRLSG